MIDKFNIEDMSAVLSMIPTALLEIDPDCSPSEAETLAMLTEVLRGNGMIYLRVYRIDGKVVGLIGGLKSKGLLVSDIICTALLAYVLPEYRSNGYTVELYRDFESWAESKGAHRIIFTSMTAYENLNEALRVELGLEHHGIMLMKRLDKE